MKSRNLTLRLSKEFMCDSEQTTRKFSIAWQL